MITIGRATMTKSLLFALFLSQAPIQDVRVFDDPPSAMEYLYADLRLTGYTQRIHTIHVHLSGYGVDVDAEEVFTTTHPPIPHIDYWRCPLQQTAQQCVAIESMIQQELPGKSILDFKEWFPDAFKK